MRTLLTVRIPAKAGTKAVLEGSIGRIMESANQELKPEYAFFCTEKGQRSANFIFDMKDASDIPMIAERFFGELEAEVELQPVMNGDDLKKGLGRLKK